MIVVLLNTQVDWIREGEEFLVRDTPINEAGYWAGAPAAAYDSVRDVIYLYYRLRKPRGLGRGYEARIAESSDGYTFHDIWRVTQEELDSPSIERGCLVFRQGLWHLFLSYVHGESRQWQIDRISAPKVSELMTVNREVELDTTGGPAHAVKDPVVFSVGPLSFMFVSYAPLELVTRQEVSTLHTGADVFTTGAVRSHTGLAVSTGGERHRWVGEVLASSSDGWDALVSRISGIIPWGNLYLAFYDGAAHVEENYEERVGLALSADLRTFYKIPSPNPWITSSYGSLRYVSPVRTPAGLFLYYEAAKDNGAHALYGRKVEWRS